MNVRVEHRNGEML